MSGKKWSSTSGMSLVEVMISMVILSMFAATILASILLGRRLAEANIYENTALTVTQGYLEQIKSMEYKDVLASYDDNTIPLPTRSVSSILSGETIEIDDPIYVNSQKNHADNTKEVLIDIRNLDTDHPSQITMDYEISPTVTNLDTGSNPKKALEVVLDYKYLSPEKGAPEWKSGSVRFVKSFVPTF